MTLVQLAVMFGLSGYEMNNVRFMLDWPEFKSGEYVLGVCNLLGSGTMAVRLVEKKSLLDDEPHYRYLSYIGRRVCKGLKKHLVRTLQEGEVVL